MDFCLKSPFPREGRKNWTMEGTWWIIHAGLAIGNLFSNICFTGFIDCVQITKNTSDYKVIKEGLATILYEAAAGMPNCSCLTIQGFNFHKVWHKSCSRLDYQFFHLVIKTPWTLLFRQLTARSIRLGIECESVCLDHRNVGYSQHHSMFITTRLPAACFNITGYGWIFVNFVIDIVALSGWRRRLWL